MFCRVQLIAGTITLLCCLVFNASSLFAQEAAPVDGGWPRGYATPTGGEITLYAPQVSSWDDQKHVIAFCAVSYLPPGVAKSALGTVKVEAETQVSIEERLVKLDKLQFTESNFPTLTRDQTREVMTELVASFPDTARIIALDRVLAAVDKSQILPQNLEGIKADPPPIYFSTRPAVLVMFDGDPIWSPIKDNDLKFAVNTNWDFFQHTTTNTFYLRIDESWLKASELNGPWTPAGDLPGSFKKLPDDDNWKEVKANVPGEKLSEKNAPTIFVTVKPAELILLDGEPKYVAISGTQLQWISNSEGDVFRLGKTGAVYFLVSGRWFSAPDFEGPWEFATPNLPEDFKNIPSEHERSEVLASVPGTDEAAEAILLAQIPQTARVNKSEVKAPEVSYEGNPEFKSIEGTSCQQAVNTDKDIIKVGDLYYMCFQGVWFMSSTATGPWEVASEVPAAIYQIPPSSECHHVTYVVVEDSDPTDAYVSCSYTSGYTGVIIAWGVIVYGSGWYYPPYVYWGHPYPVYYPRWTTYGCGVRYNPWSGAYVSSSWAYGPYGGARYATAYNPRTGTYARGGAVYGPYGAAGAAQAYNPRTGAYAATRQGANAYGSWGSTYVQRGDNWASSQRYTSNVTGQTTRVTQTDQGTAVTNRGAQGNSFVAANGENVYAGHDGNVYMKDEDGWNKYEDGGWSSVDKPAPTKEGAQTAQTSASAAKTGAPTAGSTAKTTADKGKDARAEQSTMAGKSGSGSKFPTGAISTTGQLERDQAARAKGAQRTGEFSKERSSRATPSATGRSGGGRRR